jgi:hypothetical protein
MKQAEELVVVEWAEEGANAEKTVRFGWLGVGSGH